MIDCHEELRNSLPQTNTLVSQPIGFIGKRSRPRNTVMSIFVSAHPSHLDCLVVVLPYCYVLKFRNDSSIVRECHERVSILKHNQGRIVVIRVEYERVGPELLHRAMDFSPVIGNRLQEKKVYTLTTVARKSTLIGASVE